MYPMVQSNMNPFGFFGSGYPTGQPFMNPVNSYARGGNTQPQASAEELLATVPYSTKTSRAQRVATIQQAMVPYVGAQAAGTNFDGLLNGLLDDPTVTQGANELRSMYSGSTLQYRRLLYNYTAVNQPDNVQLLASMHKWITRLENSLKQMRSLMQSYIKQFTDNNNEDKKQIERIQAKIKEIQDEGNGGGEGAQNA